MLHVLNGDVAARVFADTGLPGERLVWRDILVEGPLGAAGTAEARAAYLAARLAIDASEYARGFVDQRRALASASGHDEVVLWFEQDLFCHANLCFLLDWFAQGSVHRLSLVCPAEPLSSLGAAGLVAAHASRADVGPGALAAGARAWRALASHDPRDVEAAAGAPTAGVPFLDEALRRHLRRFPSSGNGLNEIEEEALRVLASGPLDFSRLFGAVTGAPPIRRHGMGDLQLLGDLKALAAGAAPLVEEDGGRWRLTAAGEETREGRRDRVAALGIDRWLGGVHLEGHGPLWRWDHAAAALVVS